MNIEEAKKIIKSEFINKLGTLKASQASLTKLKAITSEFAKLLEIDDHLSPATIVYCIMNDIQPKRCLHCGKQMDVYRYAAGYSKGSTFCSQQCAVDHKYDKTQGELFFNYPELLDVRGNPDSQKIDKRMNLISRDYLDELANINTSDMKTQLYSVLKDKNQIRVCKMCGEIIPVVSFSDDPYPHNKNYCSKKCRNMDPDFINHMHRVNIERINSREYIENVGIPWFENRMKLLSDEQSVSPTFTYEDTINTDKQSTYFKFKCQKCDHIFEFRLIGTPRCKKCNPTSIPQQKLTAYIESLGFSTIVEDRKIIHPYELDIVVSELKIAFEYDGLYWHRDKYNYHKHIMSEDMGYRLVVVFSDEKEDIVKSRVAAILGKTERKIFARKCNVISLTHNECSEFLNANHIQGNVSGLYQYGLMQDKELVAVMSFGKSRFDTTTEWELLRFANKLNTTVVGGASKLFQHFIKNHNPNSVISYCDLRWGTGKMYEHLGFKFIRKTGAGYSWYKRGKRESRFKFQKHKLSNLFPNVDMNKSESEIMKDQGYLKIHDFGNSVFVWIK